MPRRGLTPSQPSFWDNASEWTSSEPNAEAGEFGLAAFDQVDWSFTGSTERGLTHNLHPWPAKFIPDIPATAIALLTEPGDVVFDPFCGCGTTAVEALWAGRGFIVADINPLAVRITEGKCEVPGPRERRIIIEWSQQLTAQKPTNELLALAPDIPNLYYWFDEPVIAQLAYLLREIRSLGISQAFLETVFSSIIVSVSHQESETRYRRVEREISAEEALARFRKRLFQALGMASALDAKQDRRLSRTYLQMDARRMAEFLPAECAKLAVFSPPYPNTFDYHLYHRFRMFWLGMDPRHVKHIEIGAHLRYQPDHTGWLEDMSNVFTGLAHCLKPGGHAVCVVGNGVVRGQAVPSGDLLWEVAEKCGLEPKWRTTRVVARHRKAFNLADSRLSHEQVLVFQR